MVIVFVILGALLFWIVLQSAVSSGVQEALRKHHKWLSAHDEADTADKSV